MWTTRTSCEHLPSQSEPFKLVEVGPDKVPADYKSTRRKSVFPENRKTESSADSFPVNVVSSYFEVETADVVDQAEMRRYEHVEYVGYMGTGYYSSSEKQSAINVEAPVYPEIDRPETSGSENSDDVLSSSIYRFEPQEDDESVSWFIERAEQWLMRQPCLDEYEPEFVLKNILCTKSRQKLLSQFTDDDHELCYEDLIDRLFELEEGADYINVALKEEHHELACSFDEERLFQGPTGELKSTVPSSGRNAAFEIEDKRDIQSAERQRLVSRIWNNIDTALCQWDVGDANDEGPDRPTRVIIDKMSESCQPNYCQLHEVVKPLPLTVVRTGEWPFEPGSKSIEKLQSAHVFKKLDVAEANELREALGRVVDPKEMPHVYTTMSGGTFCSDEGRKTDSVGFNEDDDRGIQRWTGKWPFEPGSVLGDCPGESKDVKAHAVAPERSDENVSHAQQRLRWLHFDPGPRMFAGDDFKERNK